LLMMAAPDHASTRRRLTLRQGSVEGMIPKG
jgi:hypothetical protein